MTIHTLEYGVTISKEEGKQLLVRLYREQMEMEEYKIRRYKQHENYHRIMLSDNEGLRINIFVNTNDRMNRQTQIVYVVNPARVKCANDHGGYHVDRNELKNILVDVDMAVQELELPSLRQCELLRIDFCVDLTLRSELERKLLMKLVRKNGVPKGYRNLYKGTADNNANSLELENIKTKERLVVYDKTQELLNRKSPIYINDQVIRVEYKMTKDLWKNVIPKDTGMLEVLNLWLDMADGRFKQCVDDIYKPGVHYKNRIVLEKVEKYMKNGSRKLTVRKQNLYNYIVELLNVLRTRNQYHQTIRTYIRTTAGRERWKKIEMIFQELKINPIIIAEDTPIDGISGIHDLMNVFTEWQ